MALTATKKLGFENSTLQSLFDKEEFSVFEQIVQETAQEFPEIQGVLVTGSLVQRIRLPDPRNHADRTSQQRAYEEIVCRSRRKFFPHLDSDLDIWLLIDDVDEAKGIPELLDTRSLELIEWYAQQRSPNPQEWIDKKHQAFDAFYKQVHLYPRSWTKQNETPFFGWGFKETLVDNLGCGLKPVRDRIKNFFRQKYPREFLEVRAFPSSVFNLRPEKIAVGEGILDRTPFAYYLKDWLDLEKNCMVLYRRDAAPSIYPFDENGVVRGQKISGALSWNHEDINYWGYKEVEGKK